MTRARDNSLGGAEGTPDVFVDARNVQRSVWPNIPSDEFVALVREWARRQSARPVIVFDGRAPDRVEGERELEDGTVLVGTGRESADDWIARAAAERRVAETPFWLVTSDRELRVRASPGAVKTIGGGTLARELTARL
jgi:predicted RNA-binding protein with PIN domain